MKKHYLVDTNVIIDMLLDREDADAACAVFDGAERGERASRDRNFLPFSVGRLFVIWGLSGINLHHRHKTYIDIIKWL